jgi:hypothetical protein
MMKPVSRVLFLVALLGMAGQMSPGATMQARTFQLAGNASLYDPYTGGATVCPQGSPYGGPKCEKVIPRSHPRA